MGLGTVVFVAGMLFMYICSIFYYRSVKKPATTIMEHIRLCRHLCNVYRIPFMSVITCLAMNGVLFSLRCQSFSVCPFPGRGNVLFFLPWQ